MFTFAESVWRASSNRACTEWNAAPFIRVVKARTGKEVKDTDGHFVMCVRKVAHVVGEKPSRGPDVSFESRMRTVAGVAASSTQLEASGL